MRKVNIFTTSPHCGHIIPPRLFRAERKRYSLHQVPHECSKQDNLPFGDSFFSPPPRVQSSFRNNVQMLAAVFFCSDCVQQVFPYFICLGAKCANHEPPSMLTPHCAFFFSTLLHCSFGPPIKAPLYQNPLSRCRHRVHGGFSEAPVHTVLKKVQHEAVAQCPFVTLLHEGDVQRLTRCDCWSN